MHSQCNTRSRVAFPIAWHHHPLTGTILHWLSVEMWRSSNSTTFKLWTFLTDSKFDECFKTSNVFNRFEIRRMF